jgi:catenin alpha
LCEAIKTISSTVAEESKSKPHPLEKPGVLGLAIEQLKNIALGIKETSRAMAAKQARLQQPEVVTKTLNLLDGKMKCIARESAALCSLDSTRSYRSSKIKHECSGLKEGLQAISETLLNQNSRLSVSEHADRVSSVVDDVIRRTDSLHTQLCRVAVDHVSDLLYDVNVPFCVMADTAKAGSRRNLEDYAKTFQHYCSEIERASSMVCNLSTHPGHVKMVKVAANELKLLSPEAVNAARTVAAQLTSKLARDNLEAYEESWLGQVRLLTCAIDDAVDIDDFLAVTEVHVVEDLKQSMAAVQCADPEGMERAACGVRGRVARLCEVVLGELQLYTNPKYSQYIRGVQQAVSKLQESDVAHFLSCIDNILDQLSENSEALIDEREFLEVATAVRDGIRQVKDAVQSIRADAVANDPDAEIANEDIQPELPPPPPHLLEDTLDTDTRLETEIERIGEAFAESEGLQAGVTTPRPHSRTFIREAEREFDQGELTNLPPEQRQEFQALKEEKQQLESEVDKWGDNTSDLIVVAKDMGMMLVEMSDFTRGAGPLKSTMELIATAKEIADAASAFDKLVRTAVAECPDEKSRGDMLASLEKITFYTHQINITSKVKEDITSITGDSDSPQALENAVTLITTAKNLLNAVVATVKSSYVAYAKTSRGAGNSPNQKLQWRFKTPSKVPLVRLESHQQPSLNRISSGYRYGTLAPIRALEDFRGRSPRFPAEGDEEML